MGPSTVPLVTVACAAGPILHKGPCVQLHMLKLQVLVYDITSLLPGMCRKARPGVWYMLRVRLTKDYKYKDVSIIFVFIKLCFFFPGTLMS